MLRIWNSLDVSGKWIAALTLVSVLYFGAQIVRFFVV